MDAPVGPIAFVGRAVGKGDAPDALGAAGGETALVDRTVGKGRAALAPDLALDPFAGVFVAVGKAVGALPVLHAVEELALVDAAVVVLLDVGDGVERRLGRFGCLGGLVRLRLRKRHRRGRDHGSQCHGNGSSWTRGLWPSLLFGAIVSWFFGGPS